MAPQDRYHIQFKNRRTMITVDHDKLGENVPGGNRISQDARQYAIEALADRKLMNAVWDWRLKE